MLNHNCQKFNTIFKHFQRLGARSGENEKDFMNCVRNAYRQEVIGEKLFAQEDAWEILRKQPKWDAPTPIDPVDLTGRDEKLGDHVRPRPGKKTKSESLLSTRGSVFEFGDFMQSEFRLKREAAVTAYDVSMKKDEGILKVEELRFLDTSTDPNFVDY